MGNSEYHKLDKALAEGNIHRELSSKAKYGGINNSGGYPSFYRYVVLETIFDPVRIDSTKLDYWQHDLDVDNIKYASTAPRNAIIARRVRSSTSQDESTLILYPFFPPTLSLPCKAGEHVWVMFEDKAGLKSDLGYWFCRIVEPGFVEDVNHTHSPRRDDLSFVPSIQNVFQGENSAVYEFRNGPVFIKQGERYTSAEGAPLRDSEDVYRRLMLESEAGRITTYEPVPRFVKRPGDVAIEGTNNTLIVLGRDRVGPAASYGPDVILDPDGARGLLPSLPLSDSQVPGAGSIDLVAGRGQTPATLGTVVTNELLFNEIGKSSFETIESEGDPDFINDRSRILIAQKTRVDTNFGLTSFNVEHELGVNQGSAQPEISIVDDITNAPDGDGAIVIKTDKIRIIARSDVEFLVTGYVRADDGTMITDEDTSNWAAVVIKANGDIVMRPAAKGYIKLGSDSASKAIVCTDFDAVATDGSVTAPPINTTMGGQFGGTGIATQGTYASKILVD